MLVRVEGAPAHNKGDMLAAKLGDPLYTHLSFPVPACRHDDENRRIKTLPDSPDGTYRALWECGVCGVEFEWDDWRATPMKDATHFS
jgi:hypothetical protein